MKFLQYHQSYDRENCLVIFIIISKVKLMNNYILLTNTSKLIFFYVEFKLSLQKMNDIIYIFSILSLFNVELNFFQQIFFVFLFK